MTAGVSAASFALNYAFAKAVNDSSNDAEFRQRSDKLADRAYAICKYSAIVFTGLLVAELFVVGGHRHTVAMKATAQALAEEAQPGDPISADIKVFSSANWKFEKQMSGKATVTSISELLTGPYRGQRAYYLKTDSGNDGLYIKDPHAPNGIKSIDPYVAPAPQ